MRLMSLIITATTMIGLNATMTAADNEPRSLSLEQVIQLSASVAPVELSRLDAAIAQATVGSERANLRPNIEAVAGWARQRAYLQTDNVPYALTPDNTVDARLRVGQALIDAEIWHKTKAAERRLAAAEAGTALSLEDAAASAGMTYAELAANEALVVVRREDLTLAQELLTLARKQVDAGASEGIAATRAENRVAAARTALTAAEGAMRGSSIALARSLRLDTATTFIPSDKLGSDMARSSAPTVVLEAVSAAQHARPELRVSDENLAAIQADFQAARGARLPKIDAFADGGRTGPEFNDTVNTWRVGIEMRIPLMDHRRYDAEAARYRMDQQQILRADLMQRVSAEVRFAIVALETGIAGQESAQEERRLAERELSEARTRFSAGAAGNLELVEAQRSLSTARERVVTALTILTRARIGLARAVGVATTLR